MNEQNLPATIDLTKVKVNQLPELKKSLEPEVYKRVANHLLNTSTPAKWIKKNQFADGSLYVPIDKIEYLLDNIFSSWNVEILEVKQVIQSVLVTVRLHYSIGESKHFQDGVGAWPLQFKKDSDINNMSNLQKNAVQMAAPAAETEAIKDAAHKIGRIFGRDLNRKGLAEYENPLKPVDL